MRLLSQIAYFFIFATALCIQKSYSCAEGRVAIALNTSITMTDGIGDLESSRRAINFLLSKKKDGNFPCVDFSIVITPNHNGDLNSQVKYLENSGWTGLSEVVSSGFLEEIEAFPGINIYTLEKYIASSYSPNLQLIFSHPLASMPWVMDSGSDKNYMNTEHASKAPVIAIEEMDGDKEAQLFKYFQEGKTQELYFNTQKNGLWSSQQYLTLWTGPSNLGILDYDENHLTRDEMLDYIRQNSELFTFENQSRQLEQAKISFNYLKNPGTGFNMSSELDQQLRSFIINQMLFMHYNPEQQGQLIFIPESTRSAFIRKMNELFNQAEIRGGALDGLFSPTGEEAIRSFELAKENLKNAMVYYKHLPPDIYNSFVFNSENLTFTPGDNTWLIGLKSEDGIPIHYLRDYKDKLSESIEKYFKERFKHLGEDKRSLVMDFLFKKQNTTALASQNGVSLSWFYSYISSQEFKNFLNAAKNDLYQASPNYAKYLVDLINYLETNAAAPGTPLPFHTLTKAITTAPTDAKTKSSLQKNHDFYMRTNYRNYRSSYIKSCLFY